MREKGEWGRGKERWMKENTVRVTVPLLRGLYWESNRALMILCCDFNLWWCIFSKLPIRPCWYYSFDLSRCNAFGLLENHNDRNVHALCYNFVTHINGCAKKVQLPHCFHCPVSQWLVFFFFMKAPHLETGFRQASIAP